MRQMHSVCRTDERESNVTFMIACERVRHWTETSSGHLLNDNVGGRGCMHSYDIITSS